MNESMMRMMILIGTAVAAVLLVGAPAIATHFIKDKAATAGIRILATGLPFMSASACFNGYFLGVARVRASCLAQIAEQAVRIASVMWLIDRVAPNKALSTVFLGNVISEVAAAGLLLLFYLADLKRLQDGGEGFSDEGDFTEYDVGAEI